jgi:hypothetical protein
VTLLTGLTAAAPKPQVSGYADADASFSVSFEPAETPATSFGPDSQIAVCILMRSFRKIN